MDKKGWLGILVVVILIVIIFLAGFFVYNSYFKVKFPEGTIHWVEDGKDIYCTDSDSGFDAYNKGILKLYDKRGNEIKDPEGEVYSDSCFGEDKVKEYSCNSGDIEELIDCSERCIDGACV